jgi:hypothetical protein
LKNKIFQSIFFGNYFVGLLAIALNIESTLELGLPFNTFLYFILIFAAPTVYYTYAYTYAGVYKLHTNPRSHWYFVNKKFVKWSQIILAITSLIILIYLSILYVDNLKVLPFSYWLSAFVIILAGILYYGLLPKFIFKYNLRNTGWLKAFVIGFVWACTANVLPLLMLRIEYRGQYPISNLWIWLFINNWMFCTVNAIMFDIKDYPTDANKHLRTFIVSFGLRKTIYYILIPLSIIGMLAFFAFGLINHFSFMQLFFKTLPFILTIYLAYRLHKRQSNIFYLVVIDGLILFKAICGIIAVHFAY